MEFKRPLALTSPLTSGPRVESAQQALMRGNIFNGDYLRDDVDGRFGPATGRACVRAKYWLGYPEGRMLPVYGQQLHDQLAGKKKLSPAQWVRRKRRLKAAKEAPLRVKALAVAARSVGIKESPPDSNIVSFSKRYGLTGPWCAMFVSCCYVDAGSKAFALGKRYAYVPYVVNDARAGVNGLSVTHDPKPGDLVCFDWDGGVADHIGLFANWRNKGNAFVAVEGNTAIGNDSNGGEVMRRTRSVSQVECFVRVGR